MKFPRGQDLFAAVMFLGGVVAIWGGIAAVMVMLVLRS